MSEGRIDELERELRQLRREARLARASADGSAARPLVSFKLRQAPYALELSSAAEVLRMVALTPLAGAGPVLLGVVD